MSPSALWQPASTLPPPILRTHQWGVAFLGVLVAHVLALLSPALRWQSASEPAILPMVTRVIEVVPQLTPAPKKIGSSKTAPKGQAQRKAQAAGASARTQLSPPSPVLALEQSLSPLVVASAAQADPKAKTTSADLLMGTGRGQGRETGIGAQTVGQAKGNGDDTEKVALTVPNQVKLPANREWSFTTTHRSGALYAPNLPTVFKWKVQDGRYEVYLGAGALYSAFTKLARQSTGRIGDKGLIPQTFTAVARDGTTTSAYFERDGQERISFGKSNAQSKPLMPGAQDEISAAIQLTTMLAGEPGRYKVGDQVVVQVAQRSNAQVWIFKIAAEELVDLPAGPMRAVKLTRAPREEHDTGVTIWLAPEQQYMPVRLRLDYSFERYDDMKWSGF